MDNNNIPVPSANQFNLQNPYQEFPYVLAAGQSVPTYYDHMYFRVITQTGGTLQVQFENAGAATSVVGQGIGIELPAPRRMVSIKNVHATDAMTITIALSMGKINDNRLVISSGTVTTQETKSATLDTVADVTLTAGVATQLVPAAATVRDVFLSNKLANGVIFNFGDANTTASRGAELGIGATDVVTTAAAIYGFAAGAGVKCGIMRTKD